MRYNKYTTFTLDKVLRLTPSALSSTLSNQLLRESAHLRSLFFETLLPIYTSRVLDKNLQREDSGTISVGSLLSLFLTSYTWKPTYIVEVGTYIGNSISSIAFGASLHNRKLDIITCDNQPCNQNPLKGIELPEGSKAEVFLGSSTDMFKKLIKSNQPIDMLHLDGRLLKHGNDTELLSQLISDTTLIALDDCEGCEKGHVNLSLLKRAINTHAFISPFPKDVFQKWNLETHSLTGFLIPKSSASFSWQ